MSWDFVQFSWIHFAYMDLPKCVPRVLALLWESGGWDVFAQPSTVHERSECGRQGVFRDTPMLKITCPKLFCATCATLYSIVVKHELYTSIVISRGTLRILTLSCCMCFGESRCQGRIKRWQCENSAAGPAFVTFDENGQNPRTEHRFWRVDFWGSWK